MSNEVAQPTTFEEKMKARLRESIGDLITDEELKKLIDVGMNETFFKKTQVPKPGRAHYSNETVPGPSLIEEILTAELKDTMEEHVKTWLSEHPEEVKEIIEKVIKDGAAAAILRLIADIFHNSFFQLQSMLRNDIANIAKR